MTAAYRAQARSIMQKFLSCGTKTKYEELLPSRIQRDQSDVQIVQDTITSLFVHPFLESQLVVLSSGIVATEKPTMKSPSSVLKVSYLERFC